MSEREQGRGDRRPRGAPSGATATRNGASPETVGARMRHERLQQKVGVRELARRVGVSASLISQVELGKASPSVGTLYAIVNELGLSLDELLLDVPRTGEAEAVQSAGAVSALGEGDGDGAQPEPGPAGAPARPGDGFGAIAGAIDPVVRRGGGASLELGSGVRWERLTPQLPQDVDFLHVRYDVGGASCSEDSLMRHSGSEFGHVLAGRLGVTIAFETYELGPGDSISFESTMPHRLFNLGDTPVEAIWFVVGRRGGLRISRGNGQ